MTILHVHSEDWKISTIMKWGSDIQGTLRIHLDFGDMETFSYPVIFVLVPPLGLMTFCLLLGCIHLFAVFSTSLYDETIVLLVKIYFKHFIHYIVHYKFITWYSKIKFSQPQTTILCSPLLPAFVMQHVTVGIFSKPCCTEVVSKMFWQRFAPFLSSSLWPYDEWVSEWVGHSKSA